jgi:HD-like signal output (HDOD) protein
MAHLASRMRICSANIAHTFGLFCDIGIPLLLERFPDYQETLVLAGNDVNEKFTAIEQKRHSTSHTSIGALMARPGDYRKKCRTQYCCTTIISC